MKNIFEIMVKLQHKFNEETIENYLDKNLNWNSAIIAESGELLDSLGYKWWKKVVPDMENVKVEAIDLLHFVISDTIQMIYNHNNLNIALYETINMFKTSFLDLGINSSYTLEQQVSQLNLNSFGRFITMKQIFNHLNMSNEDVYIAYIVKNCLNKFRQDNGYKDGSYIKDWNGKEDNVIAYEIASEWGADEELFGQLYIDLGTYYNEEVLKNKTKVSIENLDYSKALKTEI